MISTMFRSTGLSVASSGATHCIAETTASAIFSDRSASSFVLSDVDARHRRSSRSSWTRGESSPEKSRLNPSRNSSVASRAMSNPSAMTRGWSPSDV